MFKLFGGKWKRFAEDSNDKSDKLFFILMNLFYFNSTLTENDVEQEFNKLGLTIKGGGGRKAKRKNTRNPNPPPQNPPPQNPPPQNPPPQNPNPEIKDTPNSGSLINDTKNKWILRELIWFDNTLIKYILRKNIWDQEMENVKQKIIEEKKQELRKDEENKKLKDDELNKLAAKLDDKNLEELKNTTIKNVNEKMAEDNIKREISIFKSSILPMTRRCIPSFISFLLALNSNNENNVYIIPFTKKYENPDIISRLPYKESSIIPFHTVVEVCIIGYNPNNNKEMKQAELDNNGNLHLGDETLNWDDEKQIYTNLDMSKSFILKLWNNKIDVNRQDDYKKDNSESVNLEEINCINELLLYSNSVEKLYKKHYLPSVLTNKLPQYTNKQDANKQYTNEYKDIDICSMFSLSPKIEMIDLQTVDIKKYIEFLLKFSNDLHKNNFIFCDWKVEQFGKYKNEIVCIDTGLNQMNKYLNFYAIPKTYLGARSIYYDLNYISMNETGTNTIRNYIYDEFLLFIDLYNTLYHSSDSKKYYKFINKVSSSFFNVAKYIYTKYQGFLSMDSKINISYVYVDKLLSMSMKNEEVPYCEDLLNRIIHFQCLVWLITKHSESENFIKLKVGVDPEHQVLLDILTNEGFADYNDDNYFNSMMCEIWNGINKEREKNNLEPIELSKMKYEYIRRQDSFQTYINEKIGIINLEYKLVHSGYIHGTYDVTINLKDITEIKVNRTSKKRIALPCSSIHPI